MLVVRNLYIARSGRSFPLLQVGKSGMLIREKQHRRRERRRERERERERKRERERERERSVPLLYFRVMIYKFARCQLAGLSRFTTYPVLKFSGTYYPYYSLRDNKAERRKFLREFSRSHPRSKTYKMIHRWRCCKRKGKQDNSGRNFR